MSSIVNQSKTITKNKVVTVHYRGTITDTGELFDSSYDEDPLVYLAGYQQMIPGFEVQLEGKQAGDRLTFTVAPEDAYGLYQEARRQEVELSSLPDGVEVGEQLAGETESGHLVPMVIIAVHEDSAIVDLNHPLAGKRLTFEVEVVDVRDASQEELDQGHISEPSE